MDNLEFSEQPANAGLDTAKEPSHEPRVQDGADTVEVKAAHRDTDEEVVAGKETIAINRRHNEIPGTTDEKLWASEILLVREIRILAVRFIDHIFRIVHVLARPRDAERSYFISAKNKGAAVAPPLLRQKQFRADIPRMYAFVGVEQI
jgi:hypothetical protein